MVWEDAREKAARSYERIILIFFVNYFMVSAAGRTLTNTLKAKEIVYFLMTHRRPLLS